MTAPSIETLGHGSFARLTTFRRDGTPVPTAVWLVRDGDGLLVLTAAASGKVKRLRHTARVLIAPSDMRGQVAAGVEDVEATATVSEDPADLERLRGLLRAKYGLQFAVSGFVNRLRSRGDYRAAQLRIVWPAVAPRADGPAPTGG